VTSFIAKYFKNVTLNFIFELSFMRKNYVAHLVFFLYDPYRSFL